MKFLRNMCVFVVLAGVLCGCYVYKIGGEIVSADEHVWVLGADDGMFFRVNDSGARGDILAVQEDRERGCYLVQAGMMAIQVRVLPLSGDTYVLQYYLGQDKGYGLEVAARVGDGVFAMAPNVDDAFARTLAKHGLELQSESAIEGYEGDLLADLKVALQDYSQQMKGQKITLFALPFDTYNSKQTEEIFEVVQQHAAWPGNS